MTEGARDLAHASVLLGLKRYEEAASLLARIVAAEPQNSRAWCLLAATHLGKGRYQEAAAAASSAITLAPFDDWPYRLASIAQRHLGKTTAAISSATEACRLAPHQWRVYICLAQALLATKTDNLALSEQTYYQYCQAAEQAAATALRLAPYEPDAHFTAGQVSYAQRKWKAARAHQERALALNPAHSDALNELGRISLRRGGSPRAARHFLQAARSAPGVSAYGRNAELSVRRVLAVTIFAMYLASAALGFALEVNVSRWPAVVGYALAIALVTGYAAVQLWRMPPDIRVLLRTRRTGLALGALYGAVFIEVIAATVTSARALPAAVSFADCALIVASPFAALAIRQRKDSKTGRDDTAGVRAAKVRCLECGAEPAGAGRFCRRCGAPMAADPVFPADHRPARRPVWRRAVIIAVAACAAVACLATVLIIISGRPGTSSRPRASAAPATPRATVRWISDSFYGTGPVVAGGTVYVGSDADGTVAALDAATGRLRWTYATGSLADSSGLAVAGGTVYDSDQDGTVYALDAATGRLRWTYTDAPLAGDSSGLAVAGGTVYVSDQQGTVYALDAATGRLRWTYVNCCISDASGPAVAGGTVYVSFQEGAVYALDAATGRVRWTYTTWSIVDSVPVVAGGTVYVGSDAGGTVYALDAATGRLRWTRATGAGAGLSLAVAGGTVDVGTSDGTVYALDAATGRLRWTRATGAGAGSSLAVAGGTVDVADINGTVYALDAATGRPRWTYTTGNTIESSPAVANGTVYVDDINGTVYALDAGS